MAVEDIRQIVFVLGLVVVFDFAIFEEEDENDNRLDRSKFSEQVRRSTSP